MDLVRLPSGVVGTGRAGAAVGAALGSAGSPVLAASARTQPSRARAAALLPGVPLMAPAAVVAAAVLVVVAVPDDALAEVVAALPWRPGQVAVHLSGRHGLAVLGPAAAAGALPLALHPAVPLSGGPLPPGAAFGVTARPADAADADALVRALGGAPVRVAEEHRALWHAALAGSANSLAALVATAADLLRSAGAADPAGVLRPLLQVALAGALDGGDAALTGPVARGDAGTVAAHLAALPQAVRPAYAALARLTADRALAAGVLPTGRAGDLLAVLAAEPA